MKIRRSIAEPIRVDATWEELWKGDDNGLIASWEAGRKKRLADSTLASRACDGQLVPLPFKGGVEKARKMTRKYGTLNYLAMWQGLRGENLQIDTEDEVILKCTVTEMTIVFTNDQAKYAEP